MSNLSEQISDLIKNIRNLQARTHAEIGIVGAAMLEEQLLRALLTKMRPLNAKLKNKLFDGYGPLSSFSAKIDMSYALSTVTKEQHDDLNTVRKIRNDFAHSKSPVNFDSPQIRAHFKQFKTAEPNEADFRAFYLHKLGELDAHLERVITATDLLSEPA
jgi:DNA-binding MltR family transcriptional regulator